MCIGLGASSVSVFVVAIALVSADSNSSESECVRAAQGDHKLQLRHRAEPRDRVQADCGRGDQDLVAQAAVRHHVQPSAGAAPELCDSTAIIVLVQCTG